MGYTKIMTRRRHITMPEPARMCGGKRRYNSKTEAEAVKTEQELLSPGVELRVYRCQAGCRGWHLTRQT
ncbi:MAG: hypothetical protein ACREGJ_01065 [Candidatus Saccharimonadales bacterium]